MSGDEAAEFRTRLRPRQGFDPDERELVPGVPTTSEAHVAVRDLLRDVARSSDAGDDMQDAARRVLDGRMTMTQLMEQGGLGGFRSEQRGTTGSEGIVWR